MGLFLWITLIWLGAIIFRSVFHFLKGNPKNEGKPEGSVNRKESSFSLEVFYTLLIVYSIVITGFALIYFILSFEGIVLVEYGELEDAGVIGSLIHSFYFSGVTLLTIGYGDIVPIGIGRLIALVEALIGYILPTAFMLRLVRGQMLS